MTRTRLLTLDDASMLAALLRANRDFLAPWEPLRGDEYFTDGGQRAVVAAALERHGAGTTHPRVILDDNDGIVGRITLSEILRGPAQSCNLGYLVAEADNGRGRATAAVHEMLGIAFDELGLHRVQAGTLLHNIRSQRVLERNGFIRIGVAPSYLNIAGKWQDHALYQVVAGDHESAAMAAPSM